MVIPSFLYTDPGISVLGRAQPSAVWAALELGLNYYGGTSHDKPQ